MIATKYSNLGRLQRETFKELQIFFPGLTELIKKRIYEYNDRVLKFLKAGMRRIPYFSRIEDNALYEIMFSMRTTEFSKGTIFQKPGEDATSLFFLQEGIVEVYT